MLVSALRNDIRVECVGALDMTLDRALFLSASEFFRRTKAWRFNDVPLMSPLKNTDGSVDYDINLPADAVYQKILGVRQGTIQVRPIDQYRLRSGRVIPSRTTRINMKSTNNSKQLSEVSFITDDIIRQSPLLISYAISPTNELVDIDESTMLRWGEEIQHGAKARLFRMPNVPWRDSASSQESYLLFETGISRASTFAAAGESGSPIRTKAFA